jgi:hypothetical protein
LGPLKAGDKGIYEFWKLYLSPFDDNDVKTYLKKQYPLWNYSDRKKALEIAIKVPHLSVRPMLLAYIPDILNSQKKVQYVYQLYEIMVSAWLERESRWVDKQALRDFSERLAVNIYLNRDERGTEGVPYSELPILAINWEIQLKPWQLGGRSLLNRDANDNYKFAHRSIMEYLIALKIVSGTEFTNIILTDQIRLFICEMADKTGFLVRLFSRALPETKFSIKHSREDSNLYYLNSIDTKEVLEKYVGEEIPNKVDLRLMKFRQDAESELINILNQYGFDPKRYNKKTYGKFMKLRFLVDDIDTRLTGDERNYVQLFKECHNILYEINEINENKTFRIIPLNNDLRTLEITFFKNNRFAIS